MVAVWLDDAEAAAARAMSAAGTSCGISAWRVGSSVARAAPTMKTAAKSQPVVSQPNALANASAKATSASAPWQSRRIRRRS